MSGAWARGSVAVGGPTKAAVEKAMTAMATDAAVAKPSNSDNKPKKGVQPFDYFAVVDFEATCEDGVKLPDQEIIEFPCVLVEAATNTIVSEFQRYVRPIRNPKLSKFCTDLTGIQQATVDTAQPFAVVYQEFLAWLNQGNLGEAPSTASFAIVTCGDWDLKTMFPTQISLVEKDIGGNYRNSDVVPTFFKQWVNLKSIFARYLVPKGERPARGMEGMLSSIGKPLIGRHHSGIDDCRNIASVLMECLERGHVVDYTWPSRSIVESLRRVTTHARVVPPRSVVDAEPLAPTPQQLQLQQQGEAKPQPKKAEKKTRVASTEFLPPLRYDTTLTSNAIAATLAPTGGGGGQVNLSPGERMGLSKKISWLLRHGAMEEGLPITVNGFVLVDSLVSHRKLSQRVPLPFLAEIVATNDKQRFTLAKSLDDGLLYIRANQGHSMEGLQIDMETITDASKIPVAVHGTYYEAWEKIKTTGLNKMSRQHIHFAKGLPGEDGVISGMRKTCQVLVYLDVAKAIQDGIVLLLSSNGVILSPGLNDSGVIPPQYFKSAVDVKTGAPLI